MLCIDRNSYGRVHSSFAFINLCMPSLKTCCCYCCARLEAATCPWGTRTSLSNSRILLYTHKVLIYKHGISERAEHFSEHTAESLPNERSLLV